MSWIDHPESCLRGVAIIVSLGILLLTIQHIALWKMFRPMGAYSWALPDERPLGGLRRWVSLCLDHPGFTLIMILRASAAFFVILGAYYGTIGAISMTVLFVTSLVASYRTPLFDENAAVMNLTILAALIVHVWMPNNSFVAHIALWFVALQACIAYLGAGFAKMFSQPWRHGVHLYHVFASSMQRLPTVAIVLRDYSIVAFVLSWFTILIQIAFPLALILPTQAAFVIVAATASFHLGVAILMGLPSFFWAFLATYPAVLFVNCQNVGILY